MDTSKKSIIILPHLDDEFALTPLIKCLAKYNKTNFKIIYCAERINESYLRKNIRRKESISALSSLGCGKGDVIYLNDSFEVQDLRLWKSSKEIFQFLVNFKKEFNFTQIVTLNFEGGHPDHDSLALIVDKFSSISNIEPFYIPAYNSRQTLLVPISVFRPLKNQIEFFSTIKFSFFCWFDSLKIAYIYKTERSAFIKLLPFILYQSIFSNKIFITNILNVELVDWSNSISLKRYKTDKDEIIKIVEEQSRL